MKRLAAALSCLALAAPQRTSEAALPRDNARSASPASAARPGKAAFKAAGCAVCHRVGAVGGTTGPDLTFVGFRRGRPWLDRWLADPKAWKPGTKMPTQALRPETRAAVVEYLSSLRGEGYDRPWNAAALKSDPVRRGEAVYRLAGCVACHGPQGKGGHPNNNVSGGRIPALDAVVSTYTDGELKAKIARGSTPAKEDPAGPEPLVSMPAWGGVLDDDELSPLVAYLRTLKPAGEPKTDW